MKAKLSFPLILCTVCILLAAFKQSVSVTSIQLTAIDTFPFIQTLKEFKGKANTTIQGNITFNSSLQNDFYYIDTVNRLGYYYVEVKLGAFINQDRERLPLNIAIVIDRSGSMAGNKMKYAKEAAKAIIDKLSESDLVSVIIYDHEVTLLQPSIKAVLKDTIKKKIDAITERGSTNLWGGSEKGYEQVKASFNPAYINRVLLVSDGLATSGLTNARVILNKVRQFKDDDGITISTFGVGIDYNEVLMTDMAESGAGNYYFIDDLEKMPTILEKEILELSQIAAKNAELIIELPKGIQVTKIYAHKAEVRESKLKLTFRDLFSEEVKGVLLQFKINSNAINTLPFAAVLNYTDLADGVVKQIRNENTMVPTKRTEEILAHYNKKTLEQAVLYQSNDALEKAMLEADKGLLEGARLSLKRNKNFLDQHELLVKSSAELQRMDSINQAYYLQLLNGEKLVQDSFKLMQKSNRAASYNIRKKNY